MKDAGNRNRNRIDRVTTRTGDAGETSLADGRRYPKHAIRIELAGALDEANSALGVLAAHADAETAEAIAALQSRLFDIGAVAATGASTADWKQLAAALDARTQDANAQLAPLREFILPGGGAAAAHAHLARSMVRRAERIWWHAADEAPELGACAAGIYLNRLSDHLFVLARTLADSERFWTPHDRGGGG